MSRASRHYRIEERRHWIFWRRWVVLRYYYLGAEPREIGSFDSAATANIWIGFHERADQADYERART